MCEATRHVLSAQSLIGVQLRDGSHLSIKLLAAKAGWHVNRFAGYFPACDRATPTQLPIGALYTLIERGVLPADMLALLLPDGHRVVAVPDDMDHDEMARRCHEYLARKVEAHDPVSPDGRDISECEHGELVVLGAALKAVGS